MAFYWLVLGTLTVWRVTHLLQAEDGPWDLALRLRKRAGQGFWGRLLDCFYCLSLWVSLPVALLVGHGWKDCLLLWPALSAAAIVVERLTEAGAQARPAVYYEDEEVENGLLRQGEGAIPGDDTEPGSPGEPRRYEP